MATTVRAHTELNLLALLKHTDPIVIDDGAQAVCDCKHSAPVEHFTDHLLDLGISAHILLDTPQMVSPGIISSMRADSLAMESCQR